TAMTPLNLMEKALTLNVSPEVLEKMMNLQDRWEAKQAKKEFDEAMATLQGELPIIVKSKNGGETNSGKVAYKYAPLDVIVEQTRKSIRRNGFSYLIKTEVVDEKIKIICVVKHKLGHSEQTEVIMPLSTRTNVMSAPQQVAATITFGKRYAFMDAFGIMTGDQDTDASKKTTEPEAQAEETEASIVELRLRLESVGDITELQQKWEWLVMKHPAAAKKLEKIKDELKKKLTK
ncbi:MAG: ERF family protein, partial [Patescibacteria group bacterium]|nr:ERF family protein [Patescibacteria group bacterium]